MRIAVTGPASVDVVWARYVHLDAWSDWSPQIRRVDAPRHDLEPGLSGVVHPIVGPTVHFTVLAVDDDARTWEWRVGRGPLRVVMRHGVVRHGDGTLTLIELPTAVGLLYAPLARIALRRLVRP